MVSLELESALWARGCTLIAGIDEVGRGALAGPVSVGVAVLAQCDTWPVGLMDSKKLRASTRQRLVPELKAFAVDIEVGHASAEAVDQLGIVGALRYAALGALAALEARGVAPDHILLDGTHNWLATPEPHLFDTSPEPPMTAPVTMVVKGDNTCVSIAAAAVIAKVTRDAIMVELESQAPGYGFERNKGYGSAGHIEGLATLGPSAFHRRSWRLPGVGEA